MDLPKLEASADDKMSVIWKLKYHFGRVKKIFKKGLNCFFNNVYF